MDIEVRLKELGIEPLHPDGYHPMTKKEIAKLERSLGAKLPQDYKDFVMVYGDSIMGEITEIRSARKPPAYISASNRVLFGNFYGSYDVLSHYKNLKGRMPETMFPFGSDYSGNSYLLGVSGEDRDKVYLWDCDNERDEEDYEDEGKPVPKNLLYLNLTLLAKSFTDFVNRLESAPEEG
jgi:hypothetical protein